MIHHIELLAPAKNAMFGKAAVDHGADAVYIGASSFGARNNANNRTEEIAELVDYAHLFHCKVFATVNTLLYDNELKAAEKLIWDLYDVGVDSIIVQDMGILEMNLPPIELHASTQTNNVDIEHIKFLEQVGFKRIILARETSVKRMAEIHDTVNAELEAFVHGALCVCYSGQCYMSQYVSGRSGNRGCCSQPCRSSYSLINADGEMLRKNEHLLSLKDFSAAEHIESMIDAGISSFKIEGRLKDLAYVKNSTSYYRDIIDSIVNRRSDLATSSSGMSTHFFDADIQRTFNRGFTDYFLNDRQPMASFSTQKSIGKVVARIVRSTNNKLIVKTKETISAGDGLCYIDKDGQMNGFLVNGVNGHEITINKSVEIQPNTIVWRNNDIAFERKLQAKSAERKIAVSMTFSETNNGFGLTLLDSDGLSSTTTVQCAKEEAVNKEKAEDNIIRQLSKLGNSPYTITQCKVLISRPVFVPISLLNQMRRDVVEKHNAKRKEHSASSQSAIIRNEVPYFKQSLDAIANVTNIKSEQFYRRHGVKDIQPGLDIQLTQHPNTKDVTLMTCKYCLRYELGQCLHKKNNSKIDEPYRKDLFLLNNGKRFRLSFDCERCEMKIIST